MTFTSLRTHMSYEPVFIFKTDTGLFLKIRKVYGFLLVYKKNTKGRKNLASKCPDGDLRVLYNCQSACRVFNVLAKRLGLPCEFHYGTRENDEVHLKIFCRFLQGTVGFTRILFTLKRLDL